MLDLYVNEGRVPMVDGTLVYMRGFGDRPTAADDPAPSLRLPPHVFLADGTLHASATYPLDAPAPPHGRPAAASGPDAQGLYEVRRGYWASFFPPRTIVAETGARLRLRVHNGLAGVHRLSIPGVLDTGDIAPGASAAVDVPTPPAGTYLLEDPGNAPVERLLGLHGVLVVVPAAQRWRLSEGGTEFERQWLWICQDVDPDWGRRAQAGEHIDPEATPPVPRYFMINDRSGYAALGMSRDARSNEAAHEDTLPSGFPRRVDVRDLSAGGPGTVRSGQLLRCVNTGVVVHQLHFHGNHVWTVRRNGVDFPRDGLLGLVDAEGHVLLQQWEDVVELDPRSRKETLLPLKKPPQVVEPVWAARTEDWHYPMHCHAEPSQTAAGGLYPGGMVAGWVLAGQVSPPHHTYRSQADFASDQPKEDDPLTEFRQRPDRFFERDVFGRRLRFPDGAEHEMWSFESETSGRGFPAPVIRMTENELVHVRVEPSKGPHTIHLHGMEPDPRNDGVGHTSFEVSGSYTYQFRPDAGVPGDPNEGSAGTYFYHCHVNTVLHVQMGMVGPMLVDPVVHPSFPVPAGTRRPFVDGPLYDIATELMLVPYAVDPTWHHLNHAAGLSGEDVGLNRFRAKHFYVLGGHIAQGQPKDRVWVPRQVRANASGYPTLLRVLNLNFIPTRVRFTRAGGEPVRMASLVAHDGRAYRDTVRPGSPLPEDLGNRLVTDRLAFGAAERYDMLLLPPEPGPYEIHVDWFDWVPGAAGLRLLATRTVPLTAV
ncbi:multicopper oxidase domain-containing protein [Georgenia muralis]